MSEIDALIEQIRETFRKVPYPGDAFVQGSFEGPEPYEETAPFVGQDDWKALDAETLDAHGEALGYLSEGALRFFLPAFLVADLAGELETANPLFHLTLGFHVSSVEIPVGNRSFERRGGGTELMNPRRYGAMRFVDYERYRLSVFTREEAAVIVAYLEAKRAADAHDIEASAIDAALEGFWNQRAETAPTADRLAAHVQREDEYLAALQENACRDV